MEHKKLKTVENSVWEKHFNEIFERKSKTEIEMFLHISELIMHNQLEDNNLSKLYKVLGLEKFLDVVSILQNQTIKIPTLEEVREHYSLSVVYYYKEILGWSWKKIKSSDIVNLNPNILDKQQAISFGIRVNALSESVRCVIAEEAIKLGEEILNDGRE